MGRHLQGWYREHPEGTKWETPAPEEVTEMRPELAPPQGGVRAVAQGGRLVGRVRCGR